VLNIMTRSIFSGLVARAVPRAASRAALALALGSMFVSMATLGAHAGRNGAATATAHAAARQSDSRFTQADSDAFVRKIIAIERIGAGGSAPGAASSAASAARVRPGQLRLTTISERELNAYFRYDMRDAMPAGVTEPTITILGDGRLTATAVVDLDAVRTAQSAGWLNPMRLLSGRLPVTASGVLESQHGTARFVLDAADVSGVPVPKSLLQQVVSYYSRTTENPAGVSLDDAIELPAGIQEIRVQPGQAIVVQ
jgi:hypothetical protein